MNSNRSVVTFTLVTTLLLFSVSLLCSYTNTNLAGFQNISIISSVVKSIQPLDKDTTGIAATERDTSLPIQLTPTPQSRNLEYFETPRTIIAFYDDTSLPALPLLMQKLIRLQDSGKGKVRVAWLGDSMIEGDLLTQTVRKKLQQYFHSFGVGFIPATSVTAGFRSTVNHKWTGTWDEENFKTKNTKVPLFLSGHVFYPNNGALTVCDKTLFDSTQKLVKSLLCGRFDGNIVLTVNGTECKYVAPDRLNTIPLDSSKSSKINLTVNTQGLPVYGLSSEPESGIVVDNFSFRGITGVEFGGIDTSFLAEIQRRHPYDLVIMEYGANLMFRPDDTDYSWFSGKITPIVERMRKAMQGAEFLIISTSDRAFKYGDSWQSAKGVANLVRTQARLAYTTKSAFFNMYTSMGGGGTIVKWADSSIALANKDYIHPNHRGAEILGNIVAGAFLKDMEKARRQNLLRINVVQFQDSLNKNSASKHHSP